MYATIKKLTKTKDNPEGVSILTDTGAYKSTYEILLEISKVWKDITDINQAAILETIAGILIYLSIQKCILRTYLIAGNA